MSWVLFAGLGYFFNALAVLGDKFILAKVLPRPASYAFWQGILSLGILIFVPFGFSVPDTPKILMSLFAGALWLYGLFFFFHALRLADASRVEPLVLGLTPLALFFLERYQLGIFLSGFEILSIALLILGGFVLSWEFQKEKIFSGKFILLAAGTSLFFALSLFLMKKLFLTENFFNILIWSRFGLFFAGLSLLVFSQSRREIFDSSKILKRPKASGGVILNKIVGALGALSVFFAISRGPASLVNALQGLQHAFIFIIALFLSIYFPGALKEALGRREIFQKTFGIALVSLGVGFLIFSGNAGL